MDNQNQDISLTNLKNSDAHQALLTEPYNPLQTYELSVAWPSTSKRMTYLARSAAEHEHLGMVIEAAKDAEAECQLRSYKSSDSEIVSQKTLDLDSLVYVAKLSTRAADQFLEHAPEPLKEAVAGLLWRDQAAVTEGQSRGKVATRANSDRLSKALDLVRPYAAYRVQALEGDSPNKARTVGIDFDGTISQHTPGQYPEIGEPLPGAIEGLRTLVEQGYNVVVISSRALKPEGRTQIMDWLDAHGAPDVIVTGEKVPAEIYLDDRAQHFSDWATDLPRLLESMEQGKEVGANLCSEDKSILERVGSKYVCPACDKEVGILQTVQATLYSLLPGDKVHVKGVGNSTAGDAFLISKASEQEELSLNGKNLWIVKYANGECLPVAEQYLTKLGHDLQSQRAAEDIILGRESKLSRIGERKMAYNLDAVIESALAEASEGVLPADAVLVSIGTRYGLSPDDLDFVAEQLMDLDKKASEEVGPSSEQLTDCVRDALIEVKARSVEAKLALTAEEEADMVLGYVAEEYDLKSEAMNNDLETKVKDLILEVRGVKKESAKSYKTSIPQLSIQVWQGMDNVWYWQIQDSKGGYFNTVPNGKSNSESEAIEDAKSFVSKLDKSSEMEDYKPTLMPSLTSKPESEYDTVRFQTEAGDEPGRCRICGGPGKYSGLEMSGKPGLLCQDDYDRIEKAKARSHELSNTPYDPEAMDTWGSNNKKADGETSTLFVAIHPEDDYVLGASMDANARWPQYWAHMVVDYPKTVEVAIAERVPQALAEKLLDQGTPDQKFSDGYEAFSAVEKYLYRPYAKGKHSYPQYGEPPSGFKPMAEDDLYDPQDHDFVPGPSYSQRLSDSCMICGETKEKHERVNKKAEGDICMNCGSTFQEGIRCCDAPRKGSGEGPVMKGEVKKTLGQRKTVAYELPDGYRVVAGSSSGWIVTRHDVVLGEGFQTLDEAEAFVEEDKRSRGGIKEAYHSTKCISCDKQIQVEDAVGNEYGAGYLCKNCAPEWNKDEASMEKKSYEYTGDTCSSCGKFVPMHEATQVDGKYLCKMCAPKDSKKEAPVEKELVHASEHQQTFWDERSLSEKYPLMQQYIEFVDPIIAMLEKGYSSSRVDMEMADADPRYLMGPSLERDSTRLIMEIQQWLEDYQAEHNEPYKLSSLKKAYKVSDLGTIQSLMVTVSENDETLGEAATKLASAEHIGEKRVMIAGDTLYVDVWMESVNAAITYVESILSDMWPKEGSFTVKEDDGYGDKRDHKKIDVYVNGEYVGTTSWSLTCAEAKKHYLAQHPELDASSVKCSFSTKQASNLDVLNASLKGLTLDDQQKKIVASITQYIDEYTPDFLRSVGQFFTYEWDPGSSWEVREVEGKKQIVRREVTSKKDAPMGRHAFKEGQVLKMYTSFFPADVKVVALLGEDRYRVKSMLDSSILEADEDDLVLEDTSKGLFN